MSDAPAIVGFDGTSARDSTWVRVEAVVDVRATLSRLTAAAEAVLPEIIDGATVVVGIERWVELRAAIDQARTREPSGGVMLMDPDRTLVERWLAGETQSAIATSIGLSQVQVSRRLRLALNRLTGRPIYRSGSLGARARQWVRMELAGREDLARP